MRRELLGEEAEWGAHEENTARLLEVQAYQLDWQWARETVDHDDPDVKRERAEAKRNGIKPPARPLIPPTARRPAGLAEQRLNEYLEEIAKHVTPQSATRSVTRAEFEQAMGLD